MRDLHGPGPQRHPVQPVGQRIGRVQIFSAPGTTWSTPWWATASGATSRPNTATRLAGGAPWPRRRWTPRGRAAGCPKCLHRAPGATSSGLAGRRHSQPLGPIKKGCQRLFNKHRQPFESHITGGKAPLESDQAQQASPQAGAPLPTDARRHQAAERASAASPHTHRYCRRRPFRGSTTTDWPAATGSD